MANTTYDIVADRRRYAGNIAGKISLFVQVGMLRPQNQCGNCNMAQGLPGRIGVLKVMGLPLATVAQGKAAAALFNEARAGVIFKGSI